MEPSSLNPKPSPSEAELEAWLRGLPDEPLADAGFTDSVLARLPSRKYPWVTGLLPVAGAAIGAWLTFGEPPSWSDLAALAEDSAALLANPYILAVACTLALATILAAGAEEMN